MSDTQSQKIKLRYRTWAAYSLIADATHGTSASVDVVVPGQVDTIVPKIKEVKVVIETVLNITPERGNVTVGDVIDPVVASGNGGKTSCVIILRLKPRRTRLIAFNPAHIGS